MIACRECGQPVAVKQPGTPGRQAVYCSEVCGWRYKQRDWRRRHPRTIDRLSDVELARLSHAELAAIGVDLR